MSRLVERPWYHHAVLMVVLCAMALWAPLPEILSGSLENRLHDLMVLVGAAMQGACLSPAVRAHNTLRETASFFAIGPVLLRVWELAILGVERIYPPEQAYLSAVCWVAIAAMFLVVEGMTNDTIKRDST